MATGSNGETLALADIPNQHHLIPQKPHFAHQLTNQLLLEHRHITSVNGVSKGWTCTECLRALRNNRLPKLALANRMWIAPIPVEISELTIPEQNLISLYHPRCYVYKLHPRNLWTASESNDVPLQTGLVGNVTSFALNIPDVARMLEGKLLPHSLLILASTIAVTLIARGKVPKTWLRKTFRVRRAAVHAALLCLKYTTRHPGYRDIKIDDQALDTLPLDDIPLEIMASIGQNEDVAMAQQEAAGHFHDAAPAGPSDEPTGDKDTHTPGTNCSVDYIEISGRLIVGTTDVAANNVNPEYGPDTTAPADSIPSADTTEQGNCPDLAATLTMSLKCSGSRQPRRDPIDLLGINRHRSFKSIYRGTTAPQLSQREPSQP